MLSVNIEKRQVLKAGHKDNFFNTHTCNYDNYVQHDPTSVSGQVYMHTLTPT